MPSRTPIWGMKPATSRETGDQSATSSLPTMSRAICSPQRCGAPGSRRGYRRLLKGMAISADEAVVHDSRRRCRRARPMIASPRGTPSRPRPQPRVVEHGVALYAVTVHREDVRPLLVEERVEVDEEEVVLERLVAVAAVGAQQAGIVVVRVEAEVQVVAVVGEKDVGRLRGGQPVQCGRRWYRSVTWAASRQASSSSRPSMTGGLADAWRADAPAGARFRTGRPRTCCCASGPAWACTRSGAPAPASQRASTADRPRAARRRAPTGRRCVRRTVRCSPVT